MIVLGRIGPRFIQRIDLLKVLGNGAAGEWTKGHPCGLGKTAMSGPPCADQADARKHLVNASTQHAEHFRGMPEVPGLAEDFPIEDHHGVGAEHKVPVQGGRDVECLALRIGNHQLSGSHAPGKFLNPGGTDQDFESRTP